MFWNSIQRNIITYAKIVHLTAGAYPEIEGGGCRTGSERSAREIFRNHALQHTANERIKSIIDFTTDF